MYRTPAEVAPDPPRELTPRQLRLRGVVRWNKVTLFVFFAAFLVNLILFMVGGGLAHSALAGIYLLSTGLQSVTVKNSQRQFTAALGDKSSDDN